MTKETQSYYRAFLARDARFDGKFFVAVVTTGIYCRPICPAKPNPKNVEFFASAILAEKAGYRPCLRCRPESAPLSPAWIGKNAVVRRALRLIANHELFESDEKRFAAQFGLSPRHLRRLFEDELGKTPKQISDFVRLGFARKLIVETRLPLTEIALTSGFSSVRRFNDAIKKRFERSPSEIRALAANPPKGAGIRLSVAYRPPFDWASILHFYRTHAIPGVETVTESSYERTFRLDDTIGVIQVEPSPGSHALQLTVHLSNPRPLYRVVQNIRHMFDLESDPLLLLETFSANKTMLGLCRKYPGLRLPRGWDPFETAVGAILGQLVSVEHARRLIGELVTHYGEPVTNPLGHSAHLFPSPERLASASLSEIRTTAVRREAIRTFSRAVGDGTIRLDSTQDPKAFRESLLRLKGIGPWSSEYISLRAIGDTDAFPASDLILKRALELHSDIETEQLRPWRAYAAIYLWKEYAARLSKKVRKNDLLSKKNR